MWVPLLLLTGAGWSAVAAPGEATDSVGTDSASEPEPSPTPRASEFGDGWLFGAGLEHGLPRGLLRASGNLILLRHERLYLDARAAVSLLDGVSFIGDATVGYPLYLGSRSRSRASFDLPSSRPKTPWHVILCGGLRSKLLDGPEKPDPRYVSTNDGHYDLYLATTLGVTFITGGTLTLDGDPPAHRAGLRTFSLLLLYTPLEVMDRFTDVGFRAEYQDSFALGSHRLILRLAGGYEPGWGGMYEVAAIIPIWDRF